jgi:hypothetical protein
MTEKKKRKVAPFKVGDWVAVTRIGDLEIICDDPNKPICEVGAGGMVSSYDDEVPPATVKIVFAWGKYAKGKIYNAQAGWHAKPENVVKLPKGLSLKEMQALASLYK